MPDVQPTEAARDDAQPWNNPIGPRTLAHALGLLQLGPGERLLDVGCGNGEVLARALERWPCGAVGVDPDVTALAAARERLAFAAGRVNLQACAAADAQLQPGGFAAALCLGASHAFGAGAAGLPAALDALARLVRPGGLLVLGEGYWKRPPEPGYLSATGLQADELRRHDENLGLARERGLTPLFAARSSDAEWDLFESAFWSAAERTARERPDDPAARARWERVQGWRDAYLRWGCTTMGFGLYVLRCPGG